MEARAQSRLLDCAWPMRGERVLDVACGTGLLSIAAATSVRPEGHVIGVDISERMIDRARIRAKDRNVSNVSFERMGAENLDLPDAAFDVVLCSLGLMYVPDPARALREMARVLRPGGRIAIAVSGERERRGSLGAEGVLAGECANAGFASIEEYRIDTTQWRRGEGCRVLGEFVVARAVAPATARSPVGSTLEKAET